MPHNWNSFCILHFFPFHFHFIFLQLLSHLSARFLSTKFLSFTRRGRHIPPHGNSLTATMTRVEVSHWHSQLPEQFASSVVRRMTTEKGNLNSEALSHKRAFIKRLLLSSQEYSWLLCTALTYKNKRKTICNIVFHLLVIIFFFRNKWLEKSVVSN